MKKIQFCKIISFLLLAVIIFCLIQSIFTPKFFDRGWNHRKIIQGFYEEEDDELDVVFLGSSKFISGVSPMDLYNNYGITSYDLTTSQQNLITSYHMYQEINKTQDPQVVVIETSSLFTNTVMEANHFGIDYLKPSVNKLNLVLELYENEAGVKDVLSYVLPLYAYHTRWSELEREDFTNNFWNSDLEYHSKGFAAFFDALPYEYSGIVISEENNTKEECDDYKQNYLEQLIECIQSEDKTVILVKTPQTDWSQEKHNTIQEIADKYGVVFLDYNEQNLFDEVGFSGKYDFHDNVHLNYYGAMKLTDALGYYMSSDLELEDHRGNSNYASWDLDYEIYSNQIARQRIVEINDIDEYFSELEKISEYCTIYVSVRDEASKNISDTTIEKMHELGLDESLKDKYRYSYLAIIDEGKVYEEISEDEYLAKFGFSSDGVRYKVESAGALCGCLSYITIDDKQCSMNRRGINIVVYDNVYGDVIDSVCFDTFDEEQLAIR